MTANYRSREVFLKFLPFVFYIFALLFTLLAGKGLNNLPDNPIFKIIGAGLFVLFFASFLLIFIKTLIRTAEKPKDISGYFSWVCFFIVSIYFLFFHLHDVVNGRFLLYPLFLSDTFEGLSFLDYINSLESRSYQKVLYDIFQYLFGISFSPENLLAVNKVFAFGILVIIFVLGKRITNLGLLGLLCAVTFILSEFSHYILSSIEYGTPALFFVLISYFFLFDYLITKSWTSFLLSCLSFFLAGFFRYELAVIVGIPYLFCLILFCDQNSKSRKILWIISLVSIFRSMPVAIKMVQETDFYLHGRVLEPGLIGLMSNILNVLNHNVLLKVDLLLSSGNITIFTYANLFIFFGILYYIIHIKKFKEVPDWLLQCFAMSLLSTVYFLITIFFHVEGLRSGEKYSVYYFAFEILLTFGVISNLLQQKKKYAVLVSLVFFCLSYATSSLLNYKVIIRSWLPEMKEYQALKELSLDNKCYIVKHLENQPLISFYFPQKFKVVYYENLKNVIKPNSCFYYLDQKYLRVYANEELVEKNISTVIEDFDECDVNNISDGNYFTLKHFSCE